MIMNKEFEMFLLLPNNPIDDFFLWGFVSGLVGYAYFLYTERNDTTKEKRKVGFIASLYGVFLSGCVGGLLAIVFDRSYQISIVVGLLNQLIYLALVKAAKSGNFVAVIKEILVQYLTAGTVKK